MLSTPHRGEREKLPGYHFASVRMELGEQSADEGVTLAEFSAWGQIREANT